MYTNTVIMASQRKKTRIQIQALNKSKLSIKEIVSVLKVDERTVKWANCDGHKNKPHTGRKTKLSLKTKSKIETEMRDVLGASTRKCTKILNSSEDYLSRDKTISRTTVKGYVRSTEWSKTAYKPLVKPFLSSKNISDRLSFA